MLVNSLNAGFNRLGYQSSIFLGASLEKLGIAIALTSTCKNKLRKTLEKQASNDSSASKQSEQKPPKDLHAIL